MSQKKKLGFVMCGSFCTHREAIEVMKTLTETYDITPILSRSASEYDTRFGRASELILEVAGICGREPVTTIAEAERLGPSLPQDIMLICPCTGNTAAKLSCGITDTPAVMAAKAHLRNDKPLVIALASNDAMSANLGNIGNLIKRKSVYFVPMKQDDPVMKPHSLVADFTLCKDALDFALENKQLRPLFR